MLFYGRPSARDQCRQRSMFTGCEMQDRPIQLKCFAFGVVVQGTTLQMRRGPALAAADKRSKTRFQLFQREGLGEKVICAEIQPPHSILQRPLSRQQKD